MFALRPLLRSSPASAAPSSRSTIVANASFHTFRTINNTSQPPKAPQNNTASAVPAAVPGENAVADFDYVGVPQAEVISGAPSELLHRTVRIYRPTKSTMQSAKGKTKRWIVDWDVLQGAGRWENPLMGWASSADYVQATSLAFPSKEEAVRFAEKQGWRYKVDEPKKVIVPPKSYANNYVHVPGKLRICHTK